LVRLPLVSALAAAGPCLGGSGPIFEGGGDVPRARYDGCCRPMCGIAGGEEQARAAALDIALREGVMSCCGALQQVAWWPLLCGSRSGVAWARSRPSGPWMLRSVTAGLGVWRWIRDSAEVPCRRVGELSRGREVVERKWGPGTALLCGCVAGRQGLAWAILQWLEMGLRQVDAGAVALGMAS
jgi:hypothetical protein